MRPINVVITVAILALIVLAGGYYGGFFSEPAPAELSDEAEQPATDETTPGSAN
ncbi:MAG: hypothetical protein AAGB11_19275 [Pseudomonadota bacterium]